MFSKLVLATLGERSRPNRTRIGVALALLLADATRSNDRRSLKQLASDPCVMSWSSTVAS